MGVPLKKTSHRHGACCSTVNASYNLYPVQFFAPLPFLSTTVEMLSQATGIVSPLCKPISQFSTKTPPLKIGPEETHYHFPLLQEPQICSSLATVLSAKNALSVRTPCLPTDCSPAASELSHVSFSAEKSPNESGQWRCNRLLVAVQVVIVAARCTCFARLYPAVPSCVGEIVDALPLFNLREHH